MPYLAVYRGLAELCSQLGRRRLSYRSAAIAGSAPSRWQASIVVIVWCRLVTENYQKAVRRRSNFDDKSHRFDTIHMDRDRHSFFDRKYCT